MEHTANQYKQQGNKAYKSGDYRTALNYYNKAIQTNPNDPAFYLNRALCYFNMKNYLECVKECDRSLQLNQVYIKAMKKKAAAFVQMLKFQDALGVLKQAYAVEKLQATSNEIDEVEHFISNYTMCREALKTQNYAEALSSVTFLLGKIPDNHELKLVKIECLAKTGATDEASRELKSLQNNKTPEAMYLKGMIELYSGDSAKAKTYFSQGIRLDPENSKCQKALSNANKCERFKQEGNQLIKANNWSGAETKYTQALNLDPYNKKLNSIIYSNRALTFIKRKMWTKAAQDLNKSIELNPTYLKSYVKRAEVNMERGEYSAAIQDYAKIQQLDPKIDLKAKINEAKKKQKQAKKKDYYAILGVSKTASDQEIKKAYKKMALKYHPDRNRNKTPVEQDDASKLFRDINEAQDVLTNPEKRKLYDSGAMHADPEDFSGFQQGNMGGFGNMEGFPTSGMGGNGQTFSFRMNGQQMGGIDPSEIFSMFMGGNQGFSGFGEKGNRGRSTFKTSTGSQQYKANKFPGSRGFSGFKGFEGF